MRDMEDIYGHSTAGTVKYSVLSTPTPATDSNLKEIDFKTKIQISGPTSGFEPWALYLMHPMQT